MFDAATGAVRWSTTLVDWSETTYQDGAVRRKARPTIDARMTAAETALGELGFGPTETEGGPDETSFPHAHLAVTSSRDSGTARVVHKNHVLVEFAIGGNLEGAWYVPKAHAVMISSHVAGGEGCQGNDPSYLEVFAVPPP